MSVKVKVSNKSKAAMKRLEMIYEGDLKKLIFRAANYTQNEAKQSIQSGSKTGVLYTAYNPRRTHQSSAAGEAPATDTGNLVNNIAISIDGDRLGASVESNAEYSTYLEFGTANMAARPFLQPALEVTRPLIKRLLRDVGK